MTAEVLHRQHHLRAPHLVLRQEEPAQSAEAGDFKVPHIGMLQLLHQDGCNHTTATVVIPARTATQRQNTTIIHVRNAGAMDIPD